MADIMSLKELIRQFKIVNAANQGHSKLETVAAVSVFCWP
jgi:hypothetical protein